MNKIAASRFQSIVRNALWKLKEIEIYETLIRKIVGKSRFDDESPHYQVLTSIELGELAASICIPDGFENHGPLIGNVEKFATVGKTIIRSSQPYFEFAAAAKRLRKIDRFMLRRAFESEGFLISVGKSTA